MNINIGNKGLHKTAVDIDISFFVPVDLFGPDARLSGREQLISHARHPVACIDCLIGFLASEPPVPEQQGVPPSGQYWMQSLSV